MSCFRVTVRLAINNRVEEKCFEDVSEVVYDTKNRFVRITKADGKTTAWFNMEYVYEVITEEM